MIVFTKNKIFNWKPQTNSSGCTKSFFVKIKNNPETTETRPEFNRKLKSNGTGSVKNTPGRRAYITMHIWLLLIYKSGSVGIVSPSKSSNTKCRGQILDYHQYHQFISCAKLWIYIKYPWRKPIRPQGSPICWSVIINILKNKKNSTGRRQTLQVMNVQHSDKDVPWPYKLNCDSLTSNKNNTV